MLLELGLTIGPYYHMTTTLSFSQHVRGFGTGAEVTVMATLGQVLLPAEQRSLVPRSLSRPRKQKTTTYTQDGSARNRQQAGGEKTQPTILTYD